MKYIYLLFAIPCFIGCTNPSKSGSVVTQPVTAAKLTSQPLPSGFNEYWYQGKAEISTFDVVQDRYGEIRQAQQVNIFVTEDLSKQKQVKLDDPAAAGEDRQGVLKLNSIRRFKTGIYDYSIMQSVFTPVDGSPTLKTTTSVQDWCGHVFFQTNLKKNGYLVQSYSYFESEGDTEIKLPVVLLEDDLWSRIRINPDAIPTGKVSMIPAATFSRLRHKAYQPQDADIQIEKGIKDNTLRVNYAGLPRALSIRYENTFPFRILGWEEVDNAKLTSKGTLKKSRTEAYWSENSNKFAPLRDSLGLTF